MYKCPKCNYEVEFLLDFCPNCLVDIKPIKKSGGSKKIQCTRCQIPLKFKGNYKFHEGFTYGVFGSVFEGLTNKESFDLYYCASCGKIEFFLPL